jgi:hypothetical protein
MAHALRSAGGETAPAVAGTPPRAVRPAYQAYRILHVGFAALPILAGLDKFFHLLVNWDQTSRRWRRGCCRSAGTPSC